MNYLVTGAAGFIGAAVAKRLIDMGNTVITIDNLSTGCIENIPKGVTFIQGNDYDEDVISRLEKYDIDAIIHIAGQSSGEISFEKPVYDLQTNVQSTLMLLKLAQERGIKKFLFASSMSVYGDQQDEYVNETFLPTPKSFYAVGKLASENYMRIFSQEYGIKCTALRFFNVYGVGQNMGNLKQGMASIYLAMALKDNHITVKGAKDRFRDFVYIDDVVDAVIKALDRTNGGLYEFYNVSTGQKQTVEEVINVITNELNTGVTVEYVEGTPGDQHGIYGNNEKIKNDLSWTPKYDFKSGMKKMTDWAKTLEM
jgi:UDP-glucose 4-epimerase